MKTAVTIAGANAKDSAFVVWRGFEKSIRKASEYGYDGVELALKRADEIDRKQLREWLKDNHMEVSCITTGQVFADLGLYFTHPDPEKRKETIQVFSNLIDLAEEFGGIINAGRTRGARAPRRTPETQKGRPGRRQKNYLWMPCAHCVTGQQRKRFRC